MSRSDIAENTAYIEEMWKKAERISERQLPVLRKCGKRQRESVRNDCLYRENMEKGRED